MKTNNRMIIKMGVAGQGYNGPDIWFFKISSTQESYDNGDHYEAAKSFAREQFGMEPEFVFDENDDCKALLNNFNWDSVEDEDDVNVEDWI